MGKLTVSVEVCYEYPGKLLQHYRWKSMHHGVY